MKENVEASSLIGLSASGVGDLQCWECTYRDHISARTEIKCVNVQRSNECTYRDQLNAQTDEWSERGVVDRKGSL